MPQTKNPKTMPLSNQGAAKKMSDLLLGYHSAKDWEKELADAIQGFALKYHELSPELVATDPEDHPSTLWHEFFVMSLQNILEELPPSVDKLKEAVDELKSKKVRKEQSRKRRLSDFDDGYYGDNIRNLGARKRVRVERVEKIRVYTMGPSWGSLPCFTLRTSRSKRGIGHNGLEYLEFTFDNHAMIDAKLGAAGKATVADNDDDDFYN